MIQRDYKEVLATCQRFGKQDPNLWVQALWYCARDSHTPPDLLEEILQVIGDCLYLILFVCKLRCLCTSASSHISLVYYFQKKGSLSLLFLFWMPSAHPQKLHFQMCVVIS